MASEPTSRLTDRKREAIVQAAIAEFRESGFSGTSMDRVAAAAGVSKRTVYNHFPSKDELFSAILDQLWSRSRAHADVVHDPGRPLRPQLMELIGHKMQLFNDPSFMDLSRVVIAEMLHNPERAKAMAARLSSREDGLPVWIDAAQRAGQLRADADPLYAAHQLMGQLKAHALWPQLLLGQPPLDEAQQARVLADTVDMFLGFYARG
ncbi:TetR/AcrR family transcriptional regulator [Paracidovorax cattleyae]|uniref:Transcriptional regulator, TetR family n=1 Tax=Paracidovorax cattleyae TaxID=80868 RepID=A0A1H0VJ50_9BURK|nr:TetR/AcrR family transcriptional regulator [Paracidovorax cattleyae]AVS72753.1 TetR/AcrR family transcriptional regulator [Paracidovorax cattleyae]SDP78341.1 transcriptional regulator, TetR family [Paracidovorax cattleyae]